MFPQPFVEGKGKEKVDFSSPPSQRGSQKKHLKLKMANGKAIIRLELKSTRKKERVSFKPMDMPMEITIVESEKSWKLVDGFLLKQISALKKSSTHN